jgi:hypothetical protein
MALTAHALTGVHRQHTHEATSCGGCAGELSSHDAERDDAQVHSWSPGPCRANGETDRPTWGLLELPERHTYRANLIALWEQWVVYVPDAAGVHCLLLSRADAERTARNAIATLLDIDPRTFDVTIDYD